jgi:TRAP-type C4-dicarboxylate transport system substrate-binding protein
MIGRHAIKIFGYTLLASLLFYPFGYGAEKSVTIKLATLAPEGSSWVKTFNALNKEVMKETDTRVQFRIYAGGVLGDEMDLLRKMKIGQIQGAALTSGGLSALFREINVFQIPFLFQNYEGVDAVLTGMDSFFKRGFEDNGYFLLGWSEGGFIYLMSTIPVSSVADLQKAKVWIWEESPMPQAIFDEAKVSAIPLSVPDVLVGLQTGLVNVVYAPPTGAISLQWFTKVKYLTNVPLVYLAAGIVVRKDIFQQIAPSYQSSIIEISQRHLKQLKAVIRNENREAIQVMTKHGTKIITPSKEQINEFKRLSERAFSREIGSYFSKKVYDEVLSILEGNRREGK